MTIDRSHPIARDLYGVWLLSIGPTVKNCRNLLLTVDGAFNGGPTWGMSYAGPSLNTTGNGGVFQQSMPSGTSVACTVAALVSVHTGNAGIGTFRASGTYRNGFLSTSGVPRYTVNYGTNVDVAGSSAFAGADAAPLLLMGTTRSRTDHEFFVNGRSEGTSTTDCGATAPARNQLLTGQTGGGNGGGAHAHYWWMAWERSFSASEALAFAADPYAFLIPVG